MNRYDLRNHLHDSELFRSLSESELQKMWALCSTRYYDEGESIYSQGECSDNLFIVADGAVCLFRLVRAPWMMGEGEVVLDILQPGHVFGWSCLIRPHVHTAMAKALRETELIIIDADVLKLTVEDNPVTGLKVILSLVQLLADRLRMAYSTLDTVFKPY